MIEVRALDLYQQGSEVQADEQKRKLSGYAAVFESRSLDLGGFREIIKPGAFADHLKSGVDVRALVDHDKRRILGRTSAGTLRLWEDEQGLADEVDIPDTSYGNDLLVSIGRGDIRGQSFGFHVVDEDWSVDTDGTPLRSVNAVRLTEISFTPSPAYESSTVDIRSEGGTQLVIPPAVIQRAMTMHGHPRRSLAERRLRLAEAA